MLLRHIVIMMLRHCHYAVERHIVIVTALWNFTFFKFWLHIITLLIVSFSYVSL
jgi:hypothetical protein